MQFLPCIIASFTDDITFQGTSAVKIIENQNRNAYIIGLQ